MHSEAATNGNGLRVYLGTSGTDGEGVHVAYFDPEQGTLTHPKAVAALPKASFLCFAGPAKKLLLTVTQPAGDNTTSGEVAGFSVESDGSLLPGNRVAAGGNNCVHLDAHGDTVISASYGSGSVASFRLEKDGTLHRESVLDFPANEHGPDSARQDRAYAHAATFSPDGGYALVNDLGCDRIRILRVDPETSKLSHHGDWHSAPGAGPRHIVKHPNGRWIYSINEMGCTVDHLEWDAAAGTLKTLATVDTLPTGVSTKDVRACELALSKDLRFLYASNRVHESFTVYTLDATNGAPTVLQHHPNPGKESRHIAVDPTGKWFLSANQFSGEVSVFELDTATGHIGRRASETPLKQASCILFG